MHLYYFRSHSTGKAKEQSKRVMGEQKNISCNPGQYRSGDSQGSPPDSGLRGLCGAQLCAISAGIQASLEPPPPPGRAGLGALRTERGRGAAVRSEHLRPHRGLALHLRRCPGSSQRCRRAPRKAVLGSVTPEWRQPGFEGSAACALGGVRPSSQVHLLPAGLCRVSASHGLSHTPGGWRSHEVGTKIKL